MQYAVLSDIHGNLEALTAVADALKAEGISRVLCLGDIVGYGADPSACLERIQDMGAPIVCGNHEAGCIGRLSLDWFHDAAKAALEWTRDQLSFGELDTLRRMPMIETTDAFTLVHASPRHPERFTYLFDAAHAAEALSHCRTPICLVGHTHIPWFVAWDKSRRALLHVAAEPSALENVSWDAGDSGVRVLINPGSVGQPRDGDPRASFAIVDPEAGTCSIRRVPYDISAAQEKIRRAGLPAILADRLAVGR